MHDWPIKKEWKLTVRDAVCSSRGTYGHPTETEWSTERFEQWHEQGVAIVSGSTYADKEEKKEEKVLDAATAQKYYDQDGVVKRTVLMTLDGLGHGPEPEDNKQISNDNQLMVDEFYKAFPTSGAIDLKKTLTTAGKAVWAEREKERKGINGGRQIIENGSAIAVAVIEHDEQKDKMRCHLANMGDTIAIILDKETLAIKKILPARQYAHDTIGGGIVCCPIPAHLIEHNPEALQSETIDDVSSGDVVVLMTDGIFDALECKTEKQELKSKKVKDALAKQHPHAKTDSALSCSEVYLAPDALEEALNPLKSKEQPSEYEIATAIVEHIEGQLISRRAENVKLQAEFNAWISLRKKAIDDHLLEVNAKDAGEEGMSSKKNKDQYTMQQWFAWKENHPNTEADKIYSFSEFKEDLNKFLPFIHVCFPEIKDVKLTDRTVNGLLYNLIKCNPRSGDCATLSVMRIPDPDVELFRAWVDFPENRVRLLPRLIQRIITKQEDKSFNVKNWQGKIVAKLEAEKYITPKSRGKADTVTKNPVYKGIELNKIFDDAIQKANAPFNKLKEICETYKEHLSKYREDELAKSKLKTLNELLTFIENKSNDLTLNIKDIGEFRNFYNTQAKSIFEKRRDSAGMTFMKGVATILSLLTVVGAFFIIPKIWAVKGKETTKKIDAEIKEIPDIKNKPE